MLQGRMKLSKFRELPFDVQLILLGAEQTGEGRGAGGHNIDFENKTAYMDVSQLKNTCGARRYYKLNKRRYIINGSPTGKDIILRP